MYKIKIKIKIYKSIPSAKAITNINIINGTMHIFILKIKQLMQIYSFKLLLCFKFLLSYLLSKFSIIFVFDFLDITNLHVCMKEFMERLQPKKRSCKFSKYKIMPTIGHIKAYMKDRYI
jgi:hypothetical protein